MLAKHNIFFSILLAFCLFAGSVPVSAASADIFDYDKWALYSS